MDTYYQSHIQLSNMFRNAVASVECGAKAVVIERDEWTDCPLDVEEFSGMHIYVTSSRVRRESILSKYAEKSCDERYARYFSIVKRPVFVFDYNSETGTLRYEPYDSKQDCFDTHNSKRGFWDGFIVFDKGISFEDADCTVNCFVTAWNQWVEGDVYQTAIYEDGEYIDGLGGLYGFDAYKDYAVEGFDELFNAIEAGEHLILDEETHEVLESYSL